MERMRINGNIYTITRRSPFTPIGSFRTTTVERVFDFAYDMSFGGNGEHRNHRTGGTHQRRKGEIFANAFQGKLAECAIYNQFYNELDITEPDFETYGLGEWDDADFYINDFKISIKSTKSFGNLLLLETRDWDRNGRYIPNDESYDFTFLVRMNPYCEEILRRNRMLYCDAVNYNELKTLVCNNNWSYDIPGYVSLEELIEIIRNDFIIPRGALLNGKTPMDAENYYIQAGDMHSIDEFRGVI